MITTSSRDLIIPSVTTVEMDTFVDLYRNISLSTSKSRTYDDATELGKDLE